MESFAEEPTISTTYQSGMAAIIKNDAKLEYPEPTGDRPPVSQLQNDTEGPGVEKRGRTTSRGAHV